MVCTVANQSWAVNIVIQKSNEQIVNIFVLKTENINKEHSDSCSFY